jgi:hypothetical protein
MAKKKPKKTEEIIRNLKSRDRQKNGQNDKRQTMIPKTLHRKIQNNEREK